MTRKLGFALALVSAAIAPCAAQDTSVVTRGDSVSIRLIDVDIRHAMSMLARYLDKPIAFANIQGQRITLETPSPVPRSEVINLMRSVAAAQNLELSLDSLAGAYTLRQRTSDPSFVRPNFPSPAAPASAIELFVVRLKHARATDVAAIVNVLYGRAAAIGELGGPAPTLGQELRQNVVPPAGVPAQAAPGAAGRVAVLSGDITIVPDANSNSLLIRASRPDFTLISAAIQEIDVRPLQVLIEVVIAEVRKDRSFDLGVEAKVPTTRIPGAGDATISGTNAGIGLGDFVLRVMNVGGIDAEFVLRAAAARGDVRIVSRPVILAANNQEADITVGSQRPFVQVQRSLPTDIAQRDQVVQYKDVGTQLTVKPTISADGYVMLQVTQQVNQATNEIQFDAPIISTRSVQTQLLVKNGQTVVIGGITDRQRDVSSGGVPILSRIPLIGALFGRQSRQVSETELFLFLKPVVLFSDEDATRETEPLRRRSGTDRNPR